MKWKDFSTLNEVIIREMLMYLFAYRVFIMYYWTNNVSVMGLPEWLPTFCRMLQTEYRAHVHVIVRTNPTPRREEDRTGNRRGFTRNGFLVWQAEKNKSCDQRSDSHDALETQKIKAEIVEFNKIPAKKIHTYVNSNYSRDIWRLLVPIFDLEHNFLIF